MKYKIITAAIILIFNTTSLKSQTPYDDDSLKTKYTGMVPATDNYNKIVWRINDLVLTVKILENLYNNNELKKYDKVNEIIDSSEWIKLMEKVHENKVSIICRQRKYDRQVEVIEFLVDGDPKLKSLNNWLLIRNALSNPIYEIVKNKKYDLTEYTKQDYINSNDISNLRLNILHSEFVLNSLETKSKVIVSAYYQLGYDNINLPSWYKGSITVGGKVELLDSENMYKKYLIVKGGWDGPINFSIKKDFVPGFMDNMFRERLLFTTSDNFYFGFSYFPRDSHSEPFKWLSIGDNPFLQINGEGTVPIGRSLKSVRKSNVNNFYSVEGHISVGGTVCNLWNSFNIGSTFSYFPLYKYLNVPAADSISVLGSKKHYLVSIEPAIERDDSPVHYYISPQINFDLVNGQKFFVLKSLLMFFDAFGVEFKYFASLSKQAVPWHYRDYVVISPIIRINFN